MEEDKPSSSSSGVGLETMEEFPPDDDELDCETEGERMEVEVGGETLCNQDGARKKWGNKRAQRLSDLGHDAYLRTCVEGKQCSTFGTSGSRKRDSAELPSPRANERRYTCLECGKSFYKIVSLSLHKTFHVPYECKECGKCFHHKSNLVLHRRVHQAMRSMDYGKRVILSPNQSPTQLAMKAKNARIAGIQTGLEPHKLIHTTEIPHQRPHCGESFENESRFHEHESTHRRRTT